MTVSVSNRGLSHLAQIIDCSNLAGNYIILEDLMNNFNNFNNNNFNNKNKNTAGRASLLAIAKVQHISSTPIVFTN